jgi:hypothetical protein
MQRISSCCFSDTGDIVNDHIALRTFDIPGMSLEWISEVFKEYGYVEKGEYHFEEKKLHAKHYEHPDGHPKIFISELELEKCSSYLRDYIRTNIGGMEFKESMLKKIGMDTVFKLTYEDYEKIKKESEYAAWLLVWGFIPNHFTVDINQLDGFDDIGELNFFLKKSGFQLNDSGGEIKGSPEELLEQSSTMASRVYYNFAGTPAREISGSYYEFAKRYGDENGELFQGFIAKSADKIFESTNDMK